MADEIDATDERITAEKEFTVRNVCAAAQAIPKGEPGECFLCGEYLARVVFVESVGELCCGGCRDKRGLK